MNFPAGEGTYGGGAGSDQDNPVTSGTANTGGGGGGGNGLSGSSGGAGGTGLVMIRYVIG